MVRFSRGGLAIISVLVAVCCLAGAASSRAAGTFLVTSADDSGDGTLRSAITDALAAGGGTIEFSIDSGVQTIALQSPLPVIKKPITIDGTTQPGFAGSPLIDIDWAGGDPRVDGFAVSGGSSSIRGVAVTDFDCGILLAKAAARNVVAGDWLGVAPDGASPTGGSTPGNYQGICVLTSVPPLDKAAVPALTAEQRGLATAGAGPAIGAADSVTCAPTTRTAAGTPRGAARRAAFASCAVTPSASAGSAPQADSAPPSRTTGDPVRTTALASNTIGGTGDGDRNVISGNGLGIYAEPGTPPSLVEGNYIGMLADGTTADGNGCSGIYLDATTGSVIGGTTAAARNVIGGNGCSAISLYGASKATIEGNWLGLDATGAALGDAYRGVDAWNSASNNVIGGGVAGAGNVIGAEGWDGVGFSGAADNNKVLGNLIGTDPTGTAAIPNQQYAVQIWAGASGNVIGGTTSADRNVLSGNVYGGVGIFDKSASNNIVEGNYIGADTSGAVALANGTGIVIASGASNNKIGGGQSGAGNVISGNTGTGVAIGNKKTSGNVVAGNLIGLTADGTAGLANGVISDSGCSGGGGVEIYDHATANVIGGTTAAARNVISDNGCIGVWVVDGASSNLVEGNYVGTDASGTTALFNWVGVQLQGDDAGGVLTSLNTVGGTAKGSGNLISGNKYSGVLIMHLGATRNVVKGNVIGLSSAGAALANQTNGVEIGFGAADNTIGGSTHAARNIISGNGQNGVSMYSAGTTGNLVAGNFIGVAADGTTPVGNGWSGVALFEAASANTIGGSKTAANVIAANSSEGVAIEDADTDANVVSANLIGFAADGTTTLPNGYDGVGLWDPGAESSGPQANVIGGSAPGAGNTIVYSAHTVGDGIWADGSTTTGNRFLTNTLTSVNSPNLGIDVTNGANGGIAPPTVSLTPTQSGVKISGTAGAVGYRIEVYKSSTCTTGHEQGQKLLATTKSGASGWSVGKFQLAGGTAITATQTDKAGNTSDFSACLLTAS